MAKNTNKNKADLSLWNEDTSQIFIEELSRINGQRMADNNIGCLSDKQKQRALEKAFKSGTITKSIFSRARDHLKEVGYDLSKVTNLDEFKELTSRQIDGLKIIVVNKAKKQKIKVKEIVDEEKKDETARQVQIEMSSKFIEQLQEDPSDEAQFTVLTQQNAQNPIAFYNFLLESTNSSPSFLSNLSKVIETTPLLPQKLRIFLGICGLFKGKPLQIASNLYCPMLEQLATRPEVNSKQAGGFIRLAFQNEISLASCPFPAILDFDKKFSQYFDQFFVQIQQDHWKSQMIFSLLPSTCLMLSSPMIKALKEPSSFDGIDPQHLAFFLCVLSYQAGTNYEQFNNIIKTFKESTVNSFEYMKDTSFDSFLKYLVKRMTQFDVKWFRKQQAVYELLKGVLQMVDQRKVPDIFTQEFCQTILDGCNIKEYLDRPARILSGNNDDELQTLIDSIQKCNGPKPFKQLSQILDMNYPEEYLTPFQFVGIELTQQQDIFMKMCFNQRQVFLCTGPGVGKTTYLCALIISKALALKQKILFLNSNKNIRYRDFVRVLDWLQLIKGCELLTAGEYSQQGACSSIIFISPEEILTFDTSLEFHIIVDEFQTLLSETVKDLAHIFEKAASFVGVTGSTMAKPHQDVLKIILPNSLLINFPDTYKFNSIEQETIITSTVPQQLKQIDSLIKQTQNVAPLLLIMDKQLIEHCKQKDKERKWITFLDDLEAPVFKVILEQKFSQQVNGLYGCYAGTETAGVGAEYPSNPTIESNGGVRVCICLQPKTYSDLCQFKRRTGRMSRKGVIHYIFADKANHGNRNYMEVLCNLLKEQEADQMRKLKQYLSTSLRRVDETEKEVEPGNNNSHRQLQKKFKQQLNIQEKKDLEMKNQDVKQIITSTIVNESELDGQDGNNSKDSVFNTQRQLMDIDSDDEDEKDICQKGCGKLKHIGTCFQCYDCEEWTIIGAHNNCVKVMKDARQDKIDQINEQNDANNKDQNMNIAEEIAAKEDGSDIVLSHTDKQTDIKEVLIEGGLSVNLPRADLKEFQKQQSCYNVDMKEVQIEGGISIKLPRSELKEFQFEIINNQDEKNNKIISFAGKKTSKRIAAPHTADENSITPRLIQKTDETSNVYEELKNQDRKKKFSTGAVSSFGFVNDGGKEDNSFTHSNLQDEQVQEPLKSQKSNQKEELSSLSNVAPKRKISRRTQKIIEKNQNIEKRQQRYRK